MKLLNGDGDFACDDKCKEKYKNDKDSFFANIDNNCSIYPIITKSKTWIGTGDVEYLIETTTEIGENYGGQSGCVIDSRNAFN